MSPPPDIPPSVHDDTDDYEREAAADGDVPLHVERHIMQEIVEQKIDGKVETIRFLSSGALLGVELQLEAEIVAHQAFLIILKDGRELVFRIARRHMPRLKTESEVATLNYMRLHSTIPVPVVHHFDANPLNRLGGEYILMSKAPGVPLSKHYYHLSADNLRKLLRNLAQMLVPLFKHRFSKTGSLYVNKSLKYYQSRLPDPAGPVPQPDYAVGPIVSWPYFGNSRGDDPAIDRGPWSSTRAYLIAATEREIQDMQRDQGQGGRVHHRPHLPPEDYDYDSSTDVSDNEDEHWRTARWARGGGGMSDSDSDPGEVAYRDYRRTQHGSFLVAHAMQRVETVRAEMARFLKVMESLGAMSADSHEEFSFDMHDVSLENVFVDEEDHSKITCIIDWESTTVRPLWFCAHPPSMLEHAYPHPQLPPTVTATSVYLEEAFKVEGIGTEWAQAEQQGQALRAAHRMIEWDGWEEGLADAILGDDTNEQEEEGERTLRSQSYVAVVPGASGGLVVVNSSSPKGGLVPSKGAPGANGHARKASGGAGGGAGKNGVDLALLNGLEEGLRRNGLLNDEE